MYDNKLVMSFAYDKYIYIFDESFINGLENIE